MPYAGRRFLLAVGMALAAVTTTVSTLAPASQAEAQGLFSQPKYAAIVVDANSGEVLYAKRADALRYPASITKLMTLYLTFEALATGRLSLDERIVISPHAFGMQPSKISSHPGETLTVAQAIQAVTVHSANDVAVALAERLGGSEGRFAQLMTLRAQELGMSNSRFVNASGLPDNRQVVTARDIAILSRAIMRDYPQYYSYFGEKSFEYNGKLLMNHNHLVARMPGVDGLKTGFTNAAGFNLAASAVRNGRRLITVVLGGPSTAARDENVEELLNAGFAVLDQRARGARITLASEINEPDDNMSGPIERAPVEEGSGDQEGLKVVVQPQLRTLPVMAAARKLTAEPPAAAAAIAQASPVLPQGVAISPCPATGRRHHRPHREEACGTAAVAAAKPPAAAPEKADKPAKAETAVAAPPCPTHGRRHRHAACAADQATQVAAADAKTDKDGGRDGGKESAKGKSTEGKAAGGYMIQVGAYKNQGQAKDHLDQVAEGFGKVVGGASAQVEKAGGNYRVRFRGLSQKEAKAACQAMSAKGQACMVMGAS